MSSLKQQEAEQVNTAARKIKLLTDAPKEKTFAGFFYLWCDTFKGIVQEDYFIDDEAI
jgi:hypothetical protein